MKYRFVEKQQHLEVKEDLEVVIAEEEQPVDLFQAFYDFIITIFKVSSSE